MATTFMFYHYTPTLVGAIIFIVTFLLITLYHSIQLFRCRAWFFTPVVFGGIFEITAYACRLVSNYEPQALVPYLIASIFALVAPSLFAATIYMTLCRIMHLLDAPQHSLIDVNNLTKVFVLGDVFSFLIQTTGAGLQAGKTINLHHLGRILILLALVLQVIIFSLFLVVAIMFHTRLLKWPTRQARSSLPWQRHMQALYIASALILMRNLMRIAEYAQGFNGYINRHEALTYVFDAVPMFCAMAFLVAVDAPTLLSQARDREDFRIMVELQTRETKARQGVGSE
ncbi:hypothetical protein MMC28_002596 [Mycoblastus sanguinarius]|nr:hypothetical protein [Mycoblastus sanguinarius]